MRIIKTNLLLNTDNSYHLYQNHYIYIDSKGIITELSDTLINTNIEIIDYSEYIALPGFVDTHSHFPQHYVTGIGKGELLEWLNNFVFLAEAKLDNYELAYKQAYEFFTSAIKYGTTNIISYSTSSEITTDAAFQAANDLNIRAMIGNTMMDSHCPDDLKKSTEDNILIAERLCRKWHNANNGRLQYIVTPRFAGSCSFDLLKSAAEFARSNNLIIQTHLAENHSELEFVKSIFPDCKSYTDVYRRTGILRENTLLAHCIYLSDEEIIMIKDSGAIIAHCPSSNIYLSSGIMPTRRYLNSTIPITLGSDVGGGESLSMLAEMKSAIEVSKLNSVYLNPNDFALSPSEIFNIMYSGNQVITRSNNSGVGVGEFADLVLYSKDKFLSHPYIQTADDILSHLVYAYSNKFANKVLLMGKEVFYFYY